MTDPREDRQTHSRRDTEFPAAPWGVLGTLMGLVAVVCLFIIAGVVLVLLFGLAPQDDASVASRYVFLMMPQLLFVIVPIAAAVVTAAGPEALGLRPYSVRALFEGFAIGTGLVLVDAAYAGLLERFLPSAHAGMRIEQDLQLTMLDGPVLLMLLLAVVVAPLGEELFFRGFIFGGLRGQLGFPLASGLSAGLFALVHWMPFSLVPLFVIGLGTAVLYERHRSLAACMMAHATYNMVSLALEWYR